MTPKQVILAEVTAAREEARLQLHLLSLQAQEHFYDVEAALDTIEHRIQSGREIVTEALLHQAQDLARILQNLVARDAA